MAKMMEPADIICFGSPCSHTDVEGAPPCGCISVEDSNFYKYLFKAYLSTLGFGRGSTSEVKKGVRRIEVKCRQGRQRFKVLRKGDYLVKSSEHGEELLAKIPRKST